MKLCIQRATTRGGTPANVIFGLLALGLCGLITYQFKSQAELREKLEKMSQDKGALGVERDAALKEGQTWKTEVSSLNDKLVHFEAVQKTNQAELITLKRDLKRANDLTNQIPRLIGQRDDWKKAFEEQRDMTVRASEATKKLKEDAEAKIAEASKVANENAKTANKYAADYKELVAAFEKLRTQIPEKPAK